MKRPVALGCALLLAAVAGAADAAGATSGVDEALALLDFSAAERERIAAHGPWPPAPTRDPSNRADGSAAAVALGRAMFADTRLSVDGSLACASCHQPQQALQDGRPVAHGWLRGTRNTPGLVNVAQWRWFGWGGANDSLWAASLAPLLDATEMGNNVATLAARVRAEPDLARGYRDAFGEAPGADDERVSVDTAKALAAWLATQASPRTPFDEFRDALLRGDRTAAARYPLAAQRGLRLFIGDARCHLCHAGALFSHGEFADTGRPFFLRDGSVDAGRHFGIAGLQTSPYNRLGAYNDAGAAADPRATLTRHLAAQHRNFGEFRVPSLRQLTHTAPYMHDGSVATLEDVVRHYSDLDEERLHADGERILKPLRLSPQQAADLTAFLRSLSR